MHSLKKNTESFIAIRSQRTAGRQGIFIGFQTIKNFEGFVFGIDFHLLMDALVKYRFNRNMYFSSFEFTHIYQVRKTSESLHLTGYLVTVNLLFTHLQYS